MKFYLKYDQSELRGVWGAQCSHNLLSVDAT
jgi:hypothetical protein